MNIVAAMMTRFTLPSAQSAKYKHKIKELNTPPTDTVKFSGMLTTEKPRVLVMSGVTPSYARRFETLLDHLALAKVNRLLHQWTVILAPHYPSPEEIKAYEAPNAHFWETTGMTPEEALEKFGKARTMTFKSPEVKTEDKRLTVYQSRYDQVTDAPEMNAESALHSGLAKALFTEWSVPSPPSEDEAFKKAYLLDLEELPDKFQARLEETPEAREIHFQNILTLILKQGYGFEEHIKDASAFQRTKAQVFQYVMDKLSD